MGALWRAALTNAAPPLPLRRRRNRSMGAFALAVPQTAKRWAACAARQARGPKRQGAKGSRRHRATRTAWCSAAAGARPTRSRRKAPASAAPASSPGAPWSPFFGERVGVACWLFFLAASRPARARRLASQLSANTRDDRVQRCEVNSMCAARGRAIASSWRVAQRACVCGRALEARQAAGE